MNDLTTTVHLFAKKLVKSQIEALVDCDYDNLLTIFDDRNDWVVEGDARETLCHIIGTRLDTAWTVVEEGEAGARKHVSQLERLAEAVGLARWEVK